MSELSATTTKELLDVPFIDLVIVFETITFMVIIGSIFCCLCLVIGYFIGIYTAQKRKYKVYKPERVNRCIQYSSETERVQ